MTRAFAVIAYPLSREFRLRFEEAIGQTPDYLAVSQLRRAGLGSLARELLQYRGAAAFIPLEDESSRAIEPLLAGLALAAAPRSIEVVDGDVRRRRLPRTRVATLLGKVATASIDGAREVRRSERELAQLLRTSQSVVEYTPTRRVMYLNANLWFGVKAGGSVGHMAGVINALDEAGYTLEVASTANPPTLREGISTLRLNAPAVFGLPSETNYARFQRRVERQLTPVLAQRRPAFLYQRMSVFDYSGVTLSRQLRLPLVLEYNGSEVWAARHWGRPLRLERLATHAEAASLRHAHLVVTVSDVLGDELLARGVSEHRIVVHPNGVDPVAFSPDRFAPPDLLAQRGALDLQPDDVVATFVGTFGAWHGVDLLARAIRRLVDEDESWLRSSRVRFLLVGDGLRMADVRQILGSKADPYVRLTGLVPQAEAPSYLALSDLLLSPHVGNPDGTPFFGSPTKLFEYMAAAKPIVASRLDQIADVLTPSLSAADLPTGDPQGAADEIGVLATPGREDELISGLRFLVEHPEWRKALGENAHARALARYTWRHHVDAILEGLDRVVGDPAAG